MAIEHELQLARDIEIEPELLQRAPRLLARRAPLDDAEFSRQPAEHHVLGDRERRDEVDLLIDRRDAARLGVLRRLRMNLAPVEKHRAAVALIDAGDDLDHRRFARAVLAHERVDFAAVKIELHAVERLHAGEGFRDRERRGEAAASLMASAGPRGRLAGCVAKMVGSMPVASW